MGCLSHAYVAVLDRDGLRGTVIYENIDSIKPKAARNAHVVQCSRSIGIYDSNIAAILLNLDVADVHRTDSDYFQCGLSGVEGVDHNQVAASRGHALQGQRLGDLYILDVGSGAYLNDRVGGRWVTHSIRNE